MAVKIWDSEAQAFRDANNVPKRYSVEDNAWVETTGMAWNEEAQAWEEKWGVSSNILYLYNQGDECEEVTGGWAGGDYNNMVSYVPNKAQLQDNQIYFANNGLGTNYGVWAQTKTKVDLTDYSMINVNITSFVSLMTDGYFSCTLHMANGENIVGKSVRQAGVLSLDISNVAEEAIITLRAIVSTSISSRAYATVDRVWLER